MTEEERLRRAAAVADGVKLPDRSETDGTFGFDKIDAESDFNLPRGFVDAFALIERVAAGFRSNSSPAAEHGSGSGRSDVDGSVERSRAPQFRWGPLDVYESVGRGRFGAVYRAIDPRLDRPVALKLRQVGSDSDPGATSPRQFLEEARQMARVRHENVVSVFGADVFGGRVGIWTEFVEGQTLEDEIDDLDRGFDCETISHVGAQVARALSAVHESGLLHGDVSARNILHENGGRVLLADFGSASDLTAPSRLQVGTPLYAAPEVLIGQSPSVRSDLYSLSVLLYRLAANRFPYHGDSLAELIAAAAARQLPAWPKTLGHEWTGLREAIERGLDPNPALRWPSARALATALETAEVRRLRALGEPAWQSSNPLRVRPLPARRSALVGRHDLLRSLTDRVTQGGTLTTLVGPGGAGKTRLALEAAHTNCETAEVGSWFVDLSPVSDAEGTVPRIRAALGLTTGADEVSFLAEATAESTGLLVLDNAEHVLDALRNWVVTTLPAVPNLAVLFTSREPCGLRDEVVLRIPPFDVPPKGADAETALQSDSVQLFLDRSREAGFALQPEARNLESIIEVCRAVDGLPLGLEIAASHLAGIAPGTWQGELKTGATQWSGDQPKGHRHHSLGSVVEWAVGRLSPLAQSVFAACAVFHGGWTESSAASVLSGPLQVEDAEILEALRSLWKKSLVRQEILDDGSLGYSMLESVRSVAVAAFANSSVHSPITAKHFEHFRELYLDASSRDDADVSRTAVWTQEEYNLRAALDDSLRDPKRTEAGAGLAAELTESWANAADLPTSMHYTAAFLEKLEPGAPQRPMLLLHLAGTLFKQGDVPGCEETVGRAIAEAEALGRHPEAAHRAAGEYSLVRARTIAGLLYQACYRLEESHQSLETAIQLAEQTGDDVGLARVLYARAWTFINGDQVDTARPLLFRSIDLARRHGDLRQVCRSLSGLGMIAWVRNRAAESISYHEEAYDVLRSLPGIDRVGETNVLLSLGSAYTLAKRFSEAQEIFTRAEEMARRVGIKPLIASSIQNRANVCQQVGEHESAARLFRLAKQRQLEVDATRLAARSAGGCALALAQLGRISEAENEALWSFQTWFDEGTPTETIHLLHVLGIIDREAHDLSAAVTWLQAASDLALASGETTRGSSGGTDDSENETDMEIEALRDQLSSSDFDDALRRGKGRTFSELQSLIEARLQPRQT